MSDDMLDKMLDGMSQGYNIGWEAVGNRCVSTGAVPSSLLYGGWKLKFETIIWRWDGSERMGMLDRFGHFNEKEAAKVHNYIVNNLKRKREC